MFVEGSFASNYSWDQEPEPTALEWPPPMSPEVEPPALSAVELDGEVAAWEAPPDVPEDDEIVIMTDPDPTPAELRAHRIDSLASAVFFNGEDAPRGRGDEEWEQHEEQDRSVATSPPRRRPSRHRGPLVMLGTAVTVALSGGYAAQAFGWRLPPKLRESAQPMTAFFRNLTPAYLAELVGRHDMFFSQRPSKDEPPASEVPGLDRALPVEARDPVQATECLVADDAAVESLAEPRVEPVMDDDRSAVVTTLSAASGGEPAVRWTEPPAAAVCAVAIEDAPPPAAPVHVARATLASRERPARPVRGLVWSPTVHGLVPATDVGAITAEP